jgi:signal peptidase I
MGGLARFAGRALTAWVWIVAAACFGLLGFLGIGPHVGLYRTVTVLSGSMRPDIPPGAVLVEAPQPARTLRVGDVITYAIPIDDHHVVTHRVVRIVSGGDHPVFETQGDANDTPDPWQAQATDTTMWRVRAVVPGLGFAVHGLRGRTIQLVGVLVLPAVLCLWLVVGIWRDDDYDTDTDSVPAVAAP